MRAVHPDLDCDVCGARLQRADVDVRRHRMAWVVLLLGGMCGVLGFWLGLWIEVAVLGGGRGGGGGLTFLGCALGVPWVVAAARLGLVRQESCRACGATTRRWLRKGR